MRFLYVVALGSNLGDKQYYLRAATDALRLRGAMVIDTSRVYISEPVGGVADREFCNAALTCLSEEDPESFLKTLLNIEKDLGRVRQTKWENRVIDLDLIEAVSMKDVSESERPLSGHSSVQPTNSSGSHRLFLNTPLLTVPHPLASERDFVTIPMRDVFDSRYFTNPSFAVWRDFLRRPFRGVSQFFLATIVVGLLLRYFFAATVPFGNDEAYYWDWGRDLQLSYFDHPPLVGLLSGFGHWLLPGWPAEIQGRILVPIFYALASFYLRDIARLLRGGFLNHSEEKLLGFLLQLVPAFSLGGFFLMPDVGLFLFSTMAVWVMLHVMPWQKLPILTAIILGILWGLAGLSKYHAAVLALGAFSWFVLWRWLRFKRIDYLFLLTVTTIGLAMISPVIYWNVTHDFVSFKFQATRGLKGDGLDLKVFFRAIFGVAAFLGPLMWVLLRYRFRQFFDLKGLWSDLLSVHRSSSLLLLFVALPLLLLMLVFSLTSQTLPHWWMPAFWFLIPLLLGVDSQVSSLWKRVGLGYGLILCVVLPFCLSLTPLRDFFVSLFRGRPGGLGELTLWDAASRDVSFVEFLAGQPTGERASWKPCTDETVLLGGSRWFTVAQAASQLPWQPRIFSFDPHHINYYTDRDRLVDLAGCKIQILTQPAQVDEIISTYSLSATTQRTFVIEGHRDRPIVVLTGVLPQKL